MQTGKVMSENTNRIRFGKYILSGKTQAISKEINNGLASEWAYERINSRAKKINLEEFCCNIFDCIPFLKPDKKNYGKKIVENQNNYLEKCLKFSPKVLMLGSKAKDLDVVISDYLVLGRGLGGNVLYEYSIQPLRIIDKHIESNEPDPFQKKLNWPVFVEDNPKQVFNKMIGEKLCELAEASPYNKFYKMWDLISEKIMFWK